MSVEFKLGMIVPDPKGRPVKITLIDQRADAVWYDAVENGGATWVDKKSLQNRYYHFGFHMPRGSFSPIDSPPKANTGGSVDYYTVEINKPISAKVDKYVAECNDIIEALGMNYAEGNAFKAIWRRAAHRTLGLHKNGQDTAGLYDAEKVVFFGQRLVEQSKG